MAIKCSIRIGIGDSRRVTGLAASDALRNPEDEDMEVYEADMELTRKKSWYERV